MAIEGVIYEHLSIDHEDNRRRISTAFNGDLGEFRAAQVKFLDIIADSELGQAGHYHDYSELYFLWEGKAVFILEDITTKEQLKYTLLPRDRLLIPARVAHRADVLSGTVLVGCTEKPFISAKESQHSYKIEER